jgi:hypothetical protein
MTDPIYARPAKRSFPWPPIFIGTGLLAIMIFVAALSMGGPEQRMAEVDAAFTKQVAAEDAALKAQDNGPEMLKLISPASLAANPRLDGAEVQIHKYRDYAQKTEDWVRGLPLEIEDVIDGRHLRPEEKKVILDKFTPAYQPRMMQLTIQYSIRQQLATAVQEAVKFLRSASWRVEGENIRFNSAAQLQEYNYHIGVLQYLTRQLDAGNRALSQTQGS